jgi:hypothetical protein
MSIDDFFPEETRNVALRYFAAWYQNIEVIQRLNIYWPLPEFPERGHTQRHYETTEAYPEAGAEAHGALKQLLTWLIRVILRRGEDQAERKLEGASSTEMEDSRYSRAA